jgi:hypothetical protein
MAHIFKRHLPELWDHGLQSEESKTLRSVDLYMRMNGSRGQIRNPDKTNDPRSDETTTETKTLNRNEPDPALFQILLDYKVQGFTDTNSSPARPGEANGGKTVRKKCRTQSTTHETSLRQSGPLRAREELGSIPPDCINRHT